MAGPTVMCDLDMSHLTEEEKRIIADVMKRQQVEENKEQTLRDKYEEELKSIDCLIEQQKSSAIRAANLMDSATCQICQKTKFADGMGKKCLYCQLKSCARCSSCLKLKDKTIWACKLCQKKQSLRAKTVPWLNRQPSEENVISEEILMKPSPAAPKKFLAEWSKSTSSYSQESENPRSNLRPENLDLQGDPEDHILKDLKNSSIGAVPLKDKKIIDKAKSAEEKTKVMSKQISVDQTPFDEMCESLTRRTPSFEKVRKRPIPKHSSSADYVEKSFDANQVPYTTCDQAEGEISNQPVNNKSASTSEDSRKQEKSRNHLSPQLQRAETFVPNGPVQPMPAHLPSGEDFVQPSASLVKSDNREKLNAASTARHEKGTSSPRTNLENDGRKEKNGHKLVHQKKSLNDETKFRTENEVLPGISGYCQNVIEQSSSDEDQTKHSKRSFRGRRSDREAKRDSTTPKFYPKNSHSSSFRQSRRDENVDSDLRLSDNSSKRTSKAKWSMSSDQSYAIGRIRLTRHNSNSSLGVKVVGGRPKFDGVLSAFVTKILPGSPADVIGRLKAGDEVVEWDGSDLRNASFEEVCEIVTASKKRANVDLLVLRQLRLDDFPQEDRSVYKGVTQKDESNIRLNNQLGSIVSSCYNVPTMNRRDLSMKISPNHDNISRYRKLSFSDNLQRQIDLTKNRRSTGQIFGKIQVSLRYALRHGVLTVVLHKATDISSRNDGEFRNLFVKLFLLPDRSENSGRRSVTMANTCQPEWQENFIYKNLSREQLVNRILEITLWDYNQLENNTFLGEALLDLSCFALFNEPRWYLLADMNEDSSLRSKLASSYLNYKQPFTDRSSSVCCAAAPTRPQSCSQVDYPSTSALTVCDSPSLDSEFGLYPIFRSFHSYTQGQIQDINAERNTVESYADQRAVLVKDEPEFLREIERGDQSFDSCLDGNAPSLLAGQPTSFDALQQYSKFSDKDHLSGGKGPKKKMLINKLIPHKVAARNFFEQRKMTSFSRSEEIGQNLPSKLQLVQQPSLDSTGSLSSDSSANDLSHSLLSFRWPITMTNDPSLSAFFQTLGPGQIVGRQALASPCLGEINLAFFQRNNRLELTVLRARNLAKRPAAKYNPAPYVKIYLMNGKKCLAKAKTSIAARIPEPRFDQHIIFTEPHIGKCLQVSLWGDYGRMERKIFMGGAVVRLDDLDLNAGVEAWYKLYHSNALGGMNRTSLEILAAGQQADFQSSKSLMQ